MTYRGRWDRDIAVAGIHRSKLWRPLLREDWPYRPTLAGAVVIATLTGGSWFLAQFNLAPLAALLSALFGLIVMSAWQSGRILSAWSATTLGALGVLVSIKFAQPETLMVIATLASAASWMLGAREAAEESTRGRRRYVALFAALSVLTVLALRGVWNAMGSEGCVDLRCFFP